MPRLGGVPMSVSIPPILLAKAKDILERTGASSATISRVNRSLIYGSGGYESVLEKMKEQESK